MTATNGNEIKDYDLIKPIPPDGQFFMHVPGAYCANCGELFALYSFSHNQPAQVDANGKPFYSHCFKCMPKKP